MVKDNLALYFSPCPNDTFVFHAWLHRLIPWSRSIPLSPQLKDVEYCNQAALQGLPDVAKVSAALLPQLQHEYILLPVGAALGYNHGPKLVAPQLFPLEELGQKTVLFPGVHTTAYALAKKLFPAICHEAFCLYHEIIPQLKAAPAQGDCGVIIHETRFTLRDQGVVELADLGTLWQERYSCPLPLGVFVGKKTLGEKLLADIVKAIRASLAYAWDHPEASRAYMQQWSQEKSADIIAAHVNLYVTDETYALSSAGLRALAVLLGANVQTLALP